MGGRSATLFQSCTRKGISLVGFKVERRTVRPWDEDGPQANLRFVPERLFLWFGLKKVNCGRSALGARTVRRLIRFLSRDVFVSGGLHDVKGGRSVPGVRTVRPSNFKFVQRRCLSECSECLNCGRSANRTRTVRESSNGRL